MTIQPDPKQIYLNAEMASRLAGIDIGSNSVRLLVAEVFRGSSYRILDEEREPTRLARSIASDGRLEEDAMERTLAALETFKQICSCKLPPVGVKPKKNQGRILDDFTDMWGGVLLETLLL